MTAPTTRETADHIGEANEKVTADHAELAAKAERCTTGDPWYKDEDLRGRQSFGQFLPQDRAFIAAANPATVLSLLSEIAALRVREAALIDGKTDMFRRATQAERQRDELRKALEPFATYPLAVKMDGTVAPDEYQLTGRHDKEGNFRTVTNGDFQRARQALANQGADQ